MNMAGVFMLWRGVQMRVEQIEPYADNTYLQNKTKSNHNTNDDKFCSFLAAEQSEQSDNEQDELEPMYIMIAANSSCT